MSNELSLQMFDNAMDWWDNLKDIDKIEIYCKENKIIIE